MDIRDMDKRLFETTPLNHSQFQPINTADFFSYAFFKIHLQIIIKIRLVELKTRRNFKVRYKKLNSNVEKAMGEIECVILTINPRKSAFLIPKNGAFFEKWLRVRNVYIWMSLCSNYEGFSYSNVFLN